MEVDVPASFYTELEKLAKRLRKWKIYTVPEELILWLVAARMERGFTDIVLAKTARTGKEIIESYWRKDGEKLRQWARELINETDDRFKISGYVPHVGGHNDETGEAR